MILPPTRLTPQQKEICKRLFSFTQRTLHEQDLSKIFRGAIFATREVCRSNPDWMAQSAHSLREILYLFDYKKTKKKYDGKWIDAFRHYGSVTIEEKEFREFFRQVDGKITAVAHHQLFLSIEEYEQLLEEYQSVLMRSLDRQVDVHNQIDKFLSENTP
jgi:hypothetical protein